jgi:murein L,D-transpeptidase YcbB/YkuD
MVPANYHARKSLARLEGVPGVVMLKRSLLALACALSMAGSLAVPVWGQAAPGKSAAARTLDLDAAPSTGSAPDPLAPPDVDKPAPAAPGAPTAPSEAKPTGEIDPIAVFVRQRLVTPLSRATAAERDDYAALAAFYADGPGQPIWVSKEGFTPRATQAIGEIRKADDWGLKAAAFDLPATPDASATPDQLAEAEIKLGLAVLKYGRHARGGRLHPPSISRLFDQKPTIFDPKTLMQAIAAAEAADAYLRNLHPKHPQFQRLRQAMLAARDGGEVAATSTVKSASAGNVQRIIVNMERWRWMPENLGDFYVWDSVPEQMTMVYDKGKQVLAEKIVVGKPSSPTPMFTADMLFVIFHPSWGVPPGMKTQELWPQLRETNGGWFSSKPLASTVLKGHDLIVSHGGMPVNPDQVDWSKVDIRTFDFTQPPGPKNLLGVVKFRFPNKHDVYMHDTPERHLFGGASRVFSHGCMRVQNPVRLAEILLAHDKGWSTDKVAEYVRRGGEIKLTTPIPVHITYFTAVVDDDGKLLHRPDVYSLDSRVASALEGQSVSLASAVTTGSNPTSEPAKKAEPGAPKTKRAQKGNDKKTATPSSFDLLGLFGLSSN